MRCKRSCGRKAKPGSLSRLCQVCEQRQLSRDYDQGRYRPPRRFRRKDMREGR
jgi:hypothetical protein